MNEGDCDKSDAGFDRERDEFDDGDLYGADRGRDEAADDSAEADQLNEPAPRINTKKKRSDKILLEKKDKDVGPASRLSDQEEASFAKRFDLPADE